MRHTRYGYWLEEAGPVEPTRPLEGDTTADVVVVGARLPRPLDGVAAEGARARARRRRARGRPRRPRAERAERRLRLDALGRPADPARQRRRRAAPSRSAAPPSAPFTGSARSATSRTSTRTYRPAARCRSRRATAQVGDWDELVEACEARRRAPRGPAALARRGRGAVRARRPSSAACSCRPRRTSSRRCLALGLRASGDRGAASGSTSARRSRRVGPDGARADARRERCAAGAAVLAVNSATAGFHGFRHALLGRLEPHGDHRAGARRDRGDRLDGRREHPRLPHAAPLPPHDAGRPDRPRLGRRADGLRRRATATGSTSTASAGRHAAAALRRLFPQLARPRGRRTPGAARSTSRRRTCRSSDRAAASITGSASPATASGRPTSAARSSPASRSIAATSSRGSPIVDPDRKLFPPEPLRFVGGTTIRAALVRRDDAHDRGDSARSPHRLRLLAAPPARAAAAPLGRSPSRRRSNASTSSSAALGSTCSGARCAASVSAELQEDGRERLEEIGRQARLLAGSRRSRASLRRSGPTWRRCSGACAARRRRGRGSCGGGRRAPARARRSRGPRAAPGRAARSRPCRTTRSTS